jgi:hypothetical protein
MQVLQTCFIITFSTKKDLECGKRIKNIYWGSLCPNANLFIENSLPDYVTFCSWKKKIAKCTIGTDSSCKAIIHGRSWDRQLRSCKNFFPDVKLMGSSEEVLPTM